MTPEQGKQSGHALHAQAKTGKGELNDAHGRH